uniref:Uncharacterized protein n=1 Tax=Knipowitschia caucasica TaxID=637954 RepID=A0AAV2JUK1_KNICA
METSSWRRRHGDVVMETSSWRQLKAPQIPELIRNLHVWTDATGGQHRGKKTPQRRKEKGLHRGERTPQRRAKEKGLHRGGQRRKDSTEDKGERTQQRRTKESTLREIMTNRRVWQLLKQWMDYEQELLDSERIWEDKQDKWFSDDEADLWREDEEKWLEEKQSSRKILEEILGSSEELKEGSPEFLLKLKHQLCERRLQMERRRSMWLKKEAWYQGREASKTTIITLRKELRDLRGSFEVPESAAEVPVSAAEVPESEVQHLQQQLLLKEQMLVALRAKMEKQVELQQSTQALVQAAKQVVEVSEKESFKRQKLLQLAIEQCQQYFENHPNHSDSEEDVLVYSLTTGEMCTIDKSRMEKLRSIFLKLREKHGAPGSEDECSEESMTPEMVDGLRTSLYQRIRKTNKHLLKYCIWVSTFCIETDKLCKIQDRCIKGFINCES